MPDIVPGLTSIVVVAADSGPLLAASIGTALASDGPVEVVLVDNASTDGQVERVVDEHAGDARLRLLRNGANLGFGPACNRGAAIARGDVLVFLNPDCELLADSVRAMREALRSADRVGLLGVEVCDANGVPARGNRRRDPSLQRALASLSGLARWESRRPALQGVEMPASPSAQAGLEFVEAVSGACMAMPRTVFEAIGGFDEGYFLHVEDLDLCRRTRDAGWRVAFAAGLRVRHAQGSSSRSRPLFVSRHKHRGMWRYFRKFDPLASNPIVSGAVWVGIWSHFAVTVAGYSLRARRDPGQADRL